MYLIEEISEKAFNLNYNFDPNKTYKVRKASRAILLNQGKIALLFVGSKNYHKLPGGGVEENEVIKAALRRELIEETGWEVEITKDVGITIEYRDQINQLQISFIFEAIVKGSPKDAEFTDEEKSSGFKLEWIDIDKIDEVVNGDNPTQYIDKFISLRDKLIIQFYKNNILKA